MKRTLAIIGLGIVLLFGLSVIVSGERVVADNKGPMKVAQETQPKGTAGADVGSAAADRPQNIVHQQDVAQAPAQVAAGPDADYQIQWQSVNAGGDDMQSVDYKISSSAGQSVIGYGTSDNYQVGIGFWYGAGENCDCGVWGDITGDGNVNPLDVVYIVQYAYLTNDMRIQPPDCPREAGDVNCDGAVNPVDVVFYVQYAYLTNDMFCADPCL